MSEHRINNGATPFLSADTPTERISSTAVCLTITNNLAEIRFNRPNRLNALDMETVEAFCHAVNRATNDTAVKVIIVSGAGRGFVSGGDLGYFRAASDKPDAAAMLIAPLHHALAVLANAAQITVGKVHGATAGAGMAIALNLDMLIISDDTTLSFAYTKVGASPDCGASWILPRLVGQRKALEIALLCDPIDATAAERLGLANRVVPSDQLDEAVSQLAARLAEGPAVAHDHIKSLIRQSFERSFEQQLDDEAADFAECAATEDFSEALDAFFEKRRPRFSKKGA